MMLTEKECREALKDLYNSICELEEIKSGVETTCVFDDSLDCFKELIDQHFDNPPLKYEEIEEGKWYWHNNKKEWVKILNKDVCTSVSPVIETIHEYINFERNCLYRKQVKE